METTASTLRSLRKAGDIIMLHRDNQYFQVILLQGISPGCENELWFGGDIAEIRPIAFDNVITVAANGDVEASLLDPSGEIELCRIKDRHNGVELAAAMKPYVPDDSVLKKAIENWETPGKLDVGVKLNLRYGNWFEAFAAGSQNSLVLEESDGIYEAIAEAIKKASWLLDKSC